MKFSTESLQDQIPYYLTQEAKENLVKALENFPHKTNYYTNLYQNEFLQGDGWSCLELVRIEDCQKKSVKGIIISNSCDIDASNYRKMPINFIFSPMIKFDRYLDMLREAGIDQIAIENKANSIREQKVTSLFYLPRGCEIEQDHIALLDNVHTLSLSHFQTQQARKKLFTLSQVGFYIFLFKLSVHFCRFHENIHR